MTIPSDASPVSSTVVDMMSKGQDAKMNENIGLEMSMNDKQRKKVSFINA